MAHEFILKAVSISCIFFFFQGRVYLLVYVYYRLPNAGHTGNIKYGK